MLSAIPPHSAFWNFAFWSLSSFAFGRTWFPASTGGESLYSPPSKGSKGFLNILNYVSKSSMNQNEADFIGNKKEIRALLHAMHLENPHWNIFPDTSGLGLLFSSLALGSPMGYTELSVNVEEAKEITTYVWQNVPALQRFFPKSLDPPKCFPWAKSTPSSSDFPHFPDSKACPSVFPERASHL